MKSTALSPDEIDATSAWNSFDGQNWVQETLAIRDMDHYILASQSANKDVAGRRKSNGASASSVSGNAYPPSPPSPTQSNGQAGPQQPQAVPTGSPNANENANAGLELPEDEKFFV